jgi:hypothetical protein
MEQVIFLFISNCLPVIFYFIAFLISTKKLLAIYTFFWLIILIFGSLEMINCLDEPMSEISNFLFTVISIAWRLFLFSFGTAMVGIIGKAFIFYQKSRDQEVRLMTVQMVGLVCILLFDPLFQFGQTSFLVFIRNNFCPT